MKDKSRGFFWSQVSFFFSFLPRVLPWRAATSSEVIQMHALLHRRARRNRNCGAHTRPPINYLKEQRAGSHLLPSSIKRLDFKYNNIWDFCWFGELEELHVGPQERSRTPGGRRGAIYPNRCRSNVNRFAPSPVKIDAFLFFGAVSASGCNHYFGFSSDRFGHTSPNWNAALQIRRASTSALKPRRASIRRCRQGAIQHLMWWVRWPGTRWPKTSEKFLDQRNIFKVYFRFIWLRFLHETAGVFLTTVISKWCIHKTAV